MAASSASAATDAAGGSQPHENRMPYLGIRFIICVNGNFPSRN
jgi:microcystin-dependent protein